jgi:Transposase DDE domain group 1
MTDSSPTLLFPAEIGKEVVCRFDGGDITSDAGVLLLAQADKKIGLSQALSTAIVDKRQQSKVKHDLVTLLRERLYSIAQGYPDANDLDALKQDPALKVACDQRPQSDPDLASQPTISRLENSLTRKDLLRMGQTLAQHVIDQLPGGTKKVILDVDATDDPCHGQQEFVFFNAYYDEHCYVPLYLHVTAEDGRQRLLAVLLRPGKCGATLGLFGIVRRAVRLLRARFPDVKIVLRADSGFGCDATLRFCDKEKIGYVLGLGRNRRLQTLSTRYQIRAAIKHKFEGDGCREWGEFLYKADTWDKKRRVIVKAEVTRGELNPRYVVTSEEDVPETVYTFYCGRGDQENRIKEMKLDTDSGRTSCQRFLANQCRLLLHGAAYVLLSVLQEAAKQTKWAKAQVGTLRLRLLKVGARVVESCRRVWLHLSSSYPEQASWLSIHQQLVGAEVNAEVNAGVNMVT